MHVSHKKSKTKGGEGTKCEIHRLGEMAVSFYTGPPDPFLP